MNSIKNRYLIFFLFIGVNTFAFAQQVATLDNFTVYERNGKVYLNWVISAGSTCNGIKILRSSDTINFTETGFIVGVCGNITTPQPYDFVDENPIINSLNYYKLELGENGRSGIISIEVIDIGTNNYQLRPNPIVSKAKLYFNNPQKELLKLSIYHINGKEVSTLTTRERYFDINAENLNSGIYLFAIISAKEDILIKGKLIVAH